MAGESEVRPEIGAQSGTRRVDAAIAGLASAQYGVVSRAQLESLGLGRRAIGHRLESGRLHAVHRGVYAVGHHVLSVSARWMAAVLAAGPGAVLRRRDAAALLGIRPSERGRIEITAPRQRRRPGIDISCTHLEPDETTVIDAIPVTTVHRTLLDLAAILPRPQLERTIERAEALRLSDTVPLDALLERHRGRRGTAALREILDRGVQPAITREKLEKRFLTFLDAHALPRPEVNTDLKIAGRWFQPDFLWRNRRLIVELDGRETHGTRAAFERDRERDRILQAHGWCVVRITWRQLHDDPDAIARDLARLLDLRR
jgi:very-short-patch-repair endonuclease